MGTPTPPGSGSSLTGDPTASMRAGMPPAARRIAPRGVSRPCAGAGTAGEAAPTGRVGPARPSGGYREIAMPYCVRSLKPWPEAHRGGRGPALEPSARPGVSVRVVAVTLAPWLAPSTREPVSAEDTDLLNRIENALLAQDHTALRARGGFSAAVRIAAPLRRRTAGSEGRRVARARIRGGAPGGRSWPPPG